MKFIIILLAIITLTLLLDFKPIKENFTKPRLKVLVPLYNPGSEILERCLKSIEKQTYKEFDVCIIDDASQKESDKLKQIIDHYCNKNKWQCIYKKVNGGTLHSNILGIQKLNCNDEDIIIIVDGDDELYDENVFAKIEKVYRENDVWITFGNYVKREHGVIKPSKHVKCNRNWNYIVKNNKFRDIPFMYSHLKTFKYKLFKRINMDDLKRNGEFFKAATDVAIMVPMVEMAGDKFKCISEPLYIYTKTHTESHHNIPTKHNIQTDNAKYIKLMNKYQPLNKI